MTRTENRALEDAERLLADLAKANVARLEVLREGVTGGGWMSAQEMEDAHFVAPAVPPFLRAMWGKKGKAEKTQPQRNPATKSRHLHVRRVRCALGEGCWTAEDTGRCGDEEECSVTDKIGVAGGGGCAVEFEVAVSGGSSTTFGPVPEQLARGNRSIVVVGPSHHLLGRKAKVSDRGSDFKFLSARVRGASPSGAATDGSIKLIKKKKKRTPTSTNFHDRRRIFLDDDC